MRSVYAKVVIWCFCTIGVSLIAIGFINTFVLFRIRAQGGLMPRLDSLFLEQAVSAYESGGPSQLSDYLQTLRRNVGGQEYLVDANGIDLADGTNRAELLDTAGRQKGLPPLTLGRPPRAAMLTKSQQGQYQFITLLDPPPRVFWNLTPYYLMIVAAVGALCWALAFNIASPLRQLGKVVERFGHGDLTARANFTRRDEIGELSQAFDHMAERIATLLSAERRLLQDVSHELRSPLARMRFAAALVRTAQNREAAVGRLVREIDRLSLLVGTLLQVTSVEGDPETSNREEVQLNDLMSEIVRDCGMDAESCDCRIEFAPGGAVTELGDRELLRRAIENVVLNAVRYAPKGSAVEISVERKRAEAVIRVRDYGPGVPEDALSKIFQPFFRVDNSRNSATGGVGLGLAIARRAVVLHNGRIWAENVRPGLAVQIELPVQS